jgi:hypothetical protein
MPMTLILLYSHVVKPLQLLFALLIHFEPTGFVFFVCIHSSDFPWAVKFDLYTEIPNSEWTAEQSAATSS